MTSTSGMSDFGRIVLGCLALLVLVIPSAIVRAADWGRFRGPSGDGQVQGVMPLQWSEQENIAWKVVVPGQGHSSPVIADGKIWLTTAIAEPLSDQQQREQLAGRRDAQNVNLVGSLSLHALAFDQQTGRLLHDVQIFQPEHPEPIHITNTYASPTPVIDQGRLYVHFGTYGAAAVDTQSGQVLWRFNQLHVDHQNGPGSSPIIWQDYLITHYDGTDQQFLAALKLSDGSLAWRTDRSGEMNPTPEMKKAYCTPTIVHTQRGPELISPAADWVYGYDPRDGSELWKANYGRLGFSTVPCPIVRNGIAYVCTSFMQSKLLAIRYGGQGDVTDSHVVWTSESNIPQKPSLALVGDLLFVCSDSGILTCMDADSGEEVWRERIGGKYSASPLVHDDRVYFFSMEGKSTVIRAARQFQRLAENQLDEGFNASPAVAGGALFARTDSHLYRIQQ
ncbi:MAG: PQQ-like beta-propeller repeat protein [Pirellulaceae bacterium]|nr:PQQ-like beta-propeller repeat protein [Pirellulaceae bacterium]